MIQIFLPDYGDIQGRKVGRKRTFVNTKPTQKLHILNIKENIKVKREQKKKFTNW